MRLLLQEKKRRQNVDVRFNDENLYGQIDAGEHPCVAQDPLTDVLVSRIAEDAVGKDDAHASSWPQPVDGPLDEEHFWGDSLLITVTPCEIVFGFARPRAKS